MSLPTQDRTLIAGGPAVVIWDSAYFYSKAPIVLPRSLNTFAIDSDAVGKLDERRDPKPFDLPLDLVGEWENLDKLNPFLSLPVGSFLFGADSPLDVLRLTDDVVTRFHSAAVFSPPNITFSPRAVLLGTVGFKLMRKNNVAKTDANSYFQRYNLRDSATINYTITYGADTTTALAFNATAAQVQTALNALASITADGGVTVSGSYKGGYTVTWVTNGDRVGAFTGALTGFPTGSAFAESVTQNGTGGTPEIRVIRITPYANAYAAQAISVAAIITQPYKLSWLSNGTFTLTYGGDTTTALDFDATAQEVEDALNALASVTAAGGLDVTGAYEDDWVVTFRTNGNRTAITGTPTGMPTGTVIKAMVSQEGTASLPEIVRLKLSPWASFTAEDAISLNFTVNNTEVPSQTEGVLNYQFDGMDVEVAFTPAGPSEDDVDAQLLLQGSGAELGSSLNAGSQSLNIQNTGVYARVYGAGWTLSTSQWGRNQRALGNHTLKATRVISGGTITDLAFIGTAAP